MQQFVYTARNSTGRDVTGIVAATSKHEALALLDEQALFALKMAQRSHSIGQWRQQWALKRRVRGEVLSDTLTQLADLLAGGVSLLEALDVLSENSSDLRLGKVLAGVRQRVADGTALDDALAEHPGVFSDLTVSMVTAGMEGAFLEEALERVAGFLRRQHELKSRVMGAMTYPAILAVVGVGVTAFLIVFIVPMFQTFFDRIERSGSSLPLITVILLVVSDILTRFGWAVATVGLGLAWGAQRFLRTPNGQLWADRWKLKLPGAGTILHDLAISRFCRVLGTLLHNGVPILRSLTISSSACGNRLLKKAVLDSAKNISSGESLSGPLASSGLIPPAVMAMIRVAEQSNSLEKVLIQVANRLDQRVQDRLAVFVQMIEPVMLLTIGAMVLFIIVGVLLPVFDLGAAIE